MIALAWVFGSIAAYFTIGFGVARWDLPHCLVRYREENPGRTASKVRAEVRAISTGILVAWPFCLPYLLIARMTDRVDPVRQQERLREREREIERREREIKELERRLEHGGY